MSDSTLGVDIPFARVRFPIWHRFVKNKAALLSFILLTFLGLLAVATPLLTPFSLEETDLLLGAVGPDWNHWCGTDDLGRDMFTRLLYGARVSLMVGFLSTGVSLVIGVCYGSIAGYLGGHVDEVMMRILEILYAIPFTFFVIILMVLFGRNFYLMFIALGAISWLNMARIVRGQVLSLKNAEYVEAARALGVSHLPIIWRHIMPNILGPVIVYATLTVPGVILEEAFLSFLGLGIQEPMSSWGTLIADGVPALQMYPWMILFPCGTLIVTLMALNFLGDGLREAFDPKGSFH